MRIVLLCLSILGLSLSVQAEYRVFRLLITPKAPPSTSTATDPSSTKDAEAALGEKLAGPAAGREIISTLDPDQYRGYHHIKQDEVITYTETWMCKGRTSDFKETCPAPSRAPASQPGETPAPSTSSTPP